MKEPAKVNFLNSKIHSESTETSENLRFDLTEAPERGVHLMDVPPHQPSGESPSGHSPATAFCSTPLNPLPLPFAPMIKPVLRTLGLSLVGLSCLIGCNSGSTTPPPAGSPTESSSASGTKNSPTSSEPTKRRSDPKPLQSLARFREVASEAGVQFAYRDGQEAGRFSILESLGGGAAQVDFDLDGLNDLYFPGGGQFTPEFRATPAAAPLFQNRGDLQFRDVTALARLQVPRSYNHGIAAGDFDADGFPDLLVTGYGGLTLFHNLGDGTFVEISGAAGLDDTLWSSSAGWADFDGDGSLDLFVAHYVDWSPENDPQCPGPTPDQPREVCSPRRFKGLPDALYLSNGDGTFRNASVDGGLRQPGTDDDGQDKSLGVVIADLDLDGDPDVYVGNDTVPNFLYINQGGQLKEVALRSGTALSDRGTPDGSMGVDIVDFNLDGRPDIWVANYERESIALYRQEKGSGNPGDVFFTHVSQMVGITNVGGLFVGWGTAFFDFDRDGDEDAIVSNGHVIRFPSNSEIEQLPLLLENLDGKRFQNVAPIAGPYLAAKHRGRGLAVGDLNADGRVDVVISNVNDPVALLVNDSADTNHWLGLKLVGRSSHRDAIGAWVRLKTSAGTQMHLVKGGSSYASTSDRTLHFGLREATAAESVEIHWPSGIVQTLTQVPGDQVLTVIESPAP